MLDIKLIRENPDFVKNNLAKRGNLQALKMLDELTEYDRRWRQILTKLNELRHERKRVTTQIAMLKKSGKGAEKEILKGREMDVEITASEKAVAECEAKTHDYLMRLPNLLHESVPIGKDESNNVPIRTWGKIPKFGFPVKDHIDLGLSLDIMDIERAGKIAGARFFFLKKELAEYGDPDSALSVFFYLHVLNQARDSVH